MSQCSSLADIVILSSRPAPIMSCHLKCLRTLEMFNASHCIELMSAMESRLQTRHGIWRRLCKRSSWPGRTAKMKQGDSAETMPWISSISTAIACTVLKLVGLDLTSLGCCKEVAPWMACRRLANEGHVASEASVLTNIHQHKVRLFDSWVESRS